MNPHHTFSRHAGEYAQYNHIQRSIAQRLLAHTPDRPRTILDLGCGSGTLYKEISWEVERFVGVDFSDSMLALHPQGEHIEKIQGDFNNPALFQRLAQERFDRIYSASALQWAHDLSWTLQSLQALHSPLSLAIFTSGTFATLHRIAGVEPILRSTQEILTLTHTLFPYAHYELVQEHLPFDSVRSMLRYIQRSGVSAQRRVLEYRATKALLEHYPLDYLEFEIILIWT